MLINHFNLNGYFFSIGIMFRKILSRFILTSFFLVYLFSFQSIAQSTNVEREQLIKLLEERRTKFDAYAVAAEKHSGIFGNKTKKDMQKSNEVLTEIVETDNRIISVLNRTVDFKNFEKTNLNYNVQENSDRISNLLHSVDTLQKQLLKIKTDKTVLDKKNDRFRYFTLIAAALVSVLFIFFILRKRNSSTTPR